MQHKQQTTSNTRRGQSGYTLVELMLALALGLLVITGIVNLFVGNNQTYAVLNGQSRLQENARFAFDFISRTTRTAGYLGCAPEPQNIVRGLRGAWANIPEFNVTRLVEGHEGNAGGTFTPSLASLPGGTGGNTINAANGINTGNIEAGTDVLVLRSLRNPRRLAAVLQPGASPVVAAPGGVTDLTTNDVAFVADCEQAALFRVTNVTINGAQATLGAAFAANGGQFENRDQVDSPTGLVPFTLSVLSRAYGREALLGTIETTVFYIAPSAVTNNRGATPLALWQKQGSQPPMELVAGVNDMQILYGIDTTNDGTANANRYVTFNQVPNVEQIVALRITLGVDSVDVVPSTNAALQRTYTKTLLLRNSDGQA